MDFKSVKMFEKFTVFNNMDDDKELIEKEFMQQIPMDEEKLQSIFERNFDLIDDTNFETIFVFLHKYGYSDFNDFVDNFIEYTNQKNLKFDTSCFRDNYELNKIFGLSCINNVEKCKNCEEALFRGHTYCIERFFDELSNKVDWCRNFSLKQETCDFILTKDSSYLSAVLDYLFEIQKDDDIIAFVIKEHVPDVNKQTSFEHGSLMFRAIDKGSIDLVKVLIEKNVNLEYVDTDDAISIESPLMTAIKYDRLEIFKLFIERGMKFSEPEREYEETLISLAVGLGAHRILNYLLSQEDINSEKIQEEFIYLVSHTWFESVVISRVQIFIDHGFDINFEINGESPVFCALRSCNFDMLKLLIDKGTKLDTTQNGKTILETAKEYPQNNSNIKKIVDFLESKC